MKKKSIKLLSMLFSLLLIISTIAPTVGAVTTSTKFEANWYKHAAFGSNGVQRHLADINGDGTCSVSEVVYCLQRGVASGSSISEVWSGEARIQNTAFWQELSRTQQTITNWVLIHGYPSYTKSLWLSGVDANEKNLCYANSFVGIPLKGDRGNIDFSREPKGAFANAFKVQSQRITNSDSLQ